MKLKYNHGGEVQEIPLSTVKPQGKRLAIRHDEQNFYAPLVDAGDATASNLRTTFKGEMLAVRQMPAPEIENILIAPPRVSVMQGQSATATVSAEGNEAVAGLSFSIANNPTWITIADECILIQPSDNDLGEAIIEVRAKDIGSNASMSTAFVAEALLRPIITQLGIAPPAVTVAQGSTSTAIIHAEANSAVGGLSYSLGGAPSWIRNDNDTIWVEPTNNDVGTANVQVVAYDPNSSARADTEFVATAEMEPKITSFYVTTTKMISAQQDFDNPHRYVYVTLNATGNESVKEIQYSTNFAQVMGVSDSAVTIAGNLATLRVRSDITPGSERTISFTACDQTGKASKTITQKYIVYAEPKFEVSLWRTTVTAGSSGNVTRTITISSSGSGSLYAYGEVPLDATLTFNDTLYSSADTVKGVLKIIYPKKSQATVSGAPGTTKFYLFQASNKCFVQYERWIHEWSGAIGNMMYTGIESTRTIK